MLRYLLRVGKNGRNRCVKCRHKVAKIVGSEFIYEAMTIVQLVGIDVNSNLTPSLVFNRFAVYNYA